MDTTSLNQLEISLLESQQHLEGDDALHAVTIQQVKAEVEAHRPTPPESEFLASTELAKAWAEPLQSRGLEPHACCGLLVKCGELNAVLVIADVDDGSVLRWAAVKQAHTHDLVGDADSWPGLEAALHIAKGLTT